MYSVVAMAFNTSLNESRQTIQNFYNFIWTTLDEVFWLSSAECQCAQHRKFALATTWTLHFLIVVDCYCLSTNIANTAGLDSYVWLDGTFAVCC